MGITEIVPLLLSVPPSPWKLMPRLGVSVALLVTVCPAPTVTPTLNGPTVCAKAALVAVPKRAHTDAAVTNFTTKLLESMYFSSWCAAVFRRANLLHRSRTSAVARRPKFQVFAYELRGHAPITERS